jgi:hypothetical protein
MFNIVELAAAACEDEQKVAPCKWGNIVVGHACYCHKDDWAEKPRKCPIWRNFGTSDLSKWHQREWPLQDYVVARGRNKDGTTSEKFEKGRWMPDDGLGGCPMFESSSPG